MDRGGCKEIIAMRILSRRRLYNDWGYFLVNGTNIFSVDISPDYVGTTLTLSLRPYWHTTRATSKMCIVKDILPKQFDVEFHNFSKKHCSEASGNDILSMEVVYPQAGTWYIVAMIQSPDIFVINAKAHTCPSGCHKHGSCIVKSDIGVSYGVCKCDYGYTGFLCSDYHSLDVLAVCLLTISNIAFIPGIIVACFRKFYPEAVVYLFNMFCSTVCFSLNFMIFQYQSNSALLFPLTTVLMKTKNSELHWILDSRFYCLDSGLDALL